MGWTLTWVCAGAIAKYSGTIHQGIKAQGTIHQGGKYSLSAGSPCHYNIHCLTRFLHDHNMHDMHSLCQEQEKLFRRPLAMWAKNHHQPPSSSSI